jgi:hypothetical protein
VTSFVRMHLQHSWVTQRSCSARSGASMRSSSTSAGDPLAGTGVSGYARCGRVPHFRRSRLTQHISGADRRCQGPPVRAERSEPRSGGLDCRRTVELCRSQGGGLRALWSQRVRETGAEASWEGSSLLARKAAWLRERRRAGARVHALQRSRHSERLGCGDIHEDRAGEDLGLLVPRTAEQPCAPESPPADLVVGDGVALELSDQLDAVDASAARRAGGLAVREPRGPAA